MGAGAFAHYKNQILTPQETLETLEAYPITSFTASIAKYVKALDGEDLKNCKFPNLKYCVVGGERVNKELIRKWKENTGVELLDVYGLTEIVSYFRWCNGVIIRVRACCHLNSLSTYRNALVNPPKNK